MQRPFGVSFLFYLCLVLAGGLYSSVGHAQEKGAVGQEQAFAQGDFSSCKVCHGSKLQGNQAVDAPALPRWPQWYLRYQMENFQKGWRGQHAADVSGQLMAAVAKLMDAKAIAGSLRYLQSESSLPSNSSKRDMSPLKRQIAVQKGESLYKERCLSCHGRAEEAGREQMKAPPLHGVAAWYIIAQMNKFAEELRGYHPADTYGKQMVGIAQSLGDKSLIYLAEYLSSSSSVSIPPVSDSE